MTNFLVSTGSWLVLHWQGPILACALAIAAISVHVLEADDVRAQRLERNQKKQMRSLADRITKYGHKIHERYPTGDVIVGQWDLAEQLGKSGEIVVTALNLLLAEKKVQRSSLEGYWKLNV